MLFNFFQEKCSPQKAGSVKFESTGLSLSGLGRQNDEAGNNNNSGANNNANNNGNALKPQLLCEPNPHNITPIYVTLMDFIGELSKALYEFRVIKWDKIFFTYHT